MSVKHPDGRSDERKETPHYALASELEALRSYARGVGEWTAQNSRRVEWLENLLNGVEERIAHRTGALIDLYLSPVASEVGSLRTSFTQLEKKQVAVLESLERIEKRIGSAEEKADRAERASGTNEAVIDLADKVVGLATPVVHVSAQRSGESMRAREFSQKTRAERTKEIVMWLTTGGGIALVIGALFRACGG